MSDEELLLHCRRLLAEAKDIIKAQDEQIAALQAKVHLCAGYDALEATNKRLRKLVKEAYLEGYEHCCQMVSATVGWGCAKSANLLENMAQYGTSENEGNSRGGS